jgi:hypothetical protein
VFVLKILIGDMFVNEHNIVRYYIEKEESEKTYKVKVVTSNDEVYVLTNGSGNFARIYLKTLINELCVFTESVFHLDKFNQMVVPKLKATSGASSGVVNKQKVMLGCI